MVVLEAAKNKNKKRSIDFILRVDSMGLSHCKDCNDCNEGVLLKE